MVSRVYNVLMIATRTAAGWACVALLAAACSKKPPAAEALEKQFEQTLSGATLDGHFTTGKGGQLREEKYTISKVSKMGGDTWLFSTRIQYGDHDVTVPLPLTVKWAGDTPVITLTDFSIPGMGTFTARVLIYRDQYAGTWSGGKAGGELFGRIVRSPR